MNPHQQIGIDWDRDVNIVVATGAPRQRHASATGAQVASTFRAAHVVAYLKLLEQGPISDHAASAAIGCGLSSINGLRNSLGDRVVDSGTYETKTFPSRLPKPKGKDRVTYRTKWQLAGWTPSERVEPIDADTSPSTPTPEGENPTP